ncbi:MAG TPA: hypothetical protein VFR75_03190 [Solirubrobacterales bacterium]|nr:hypothetical protein [Solirubrobacterales bacterium]
MIRTPSSSCSSANQRPSRAPTIGPSGAGSASTTVTSTPSFRAVAATSWPMKPAPTITSRDPGTSSRRSCRRSASVRSSWTLAPARNGSRRGSPPVAITRFS